MRTLVKIFAAVMLVGSAWSIPAQAGYGVLQGCHIEYTPIKHKVCSYGPAFPTGPRAWR